MRSCCLGVVVIWLLSSIALAADFRLARQKNSNDVTVTATASGHYTLEIDDASQFRTPVFSQPFSGASTSFNAYDAGLAPGTNYYVRITASGPVKRFHLDVESLPAAQANYERLRSTWETLGRRMTASYSGAKWNPTASRWEIDDPSRVVGRSLYYAEMYVRAALEAARCCNDTKLLDEIAQYYVVMLDRTTPLDGILRKPNALSLSRDRYETADRSARTFPSTFDDKIGDCELCNVQWLYPAAKLLRLITLLPAAQRSATMNTFASQYTAFIVKDQLGRYLTQELLPSEGGRKANRIAVWNMTMHGMRGDKKWDTAMADTDLWILSSVAEVLGANANDPSLVPLDARQLDMLRTAIDVGTRLFRSKQTNYADTKNFEGQRVGSVSYFNGDYDGHPDFAYSAVTSERLPTPSQKRALPGISWDMGHFYRVPVFVRALYDNRKATRTGFPQLRDLELFINQYVYRVFDGNFSRPLFRNYFDGSDGWLRVGYSGQGFGYPPSQYCDMHTPGNNRPCMTPGQLMGWGLLAFASPNLLRVEQSLMALAVDNAPDAKTFRDRYYFYQQPFEPVGQEGRPAYGAALYFVIADNADRVGGCDGLNP